MTREPKTREPKTREPKTREPKTHKKTLDRAPRPGVGCPSMTTNDNRVTSTIKIQLDNFVEAEAKALEESVRRFVSNWLCANPPTEPGPERLPVASINEVDWTTIYRMRDPSLIPRRVILPAVDSWGDSIRAVETAHIECDGLVTFCSADACLAGDLATYNRWGDLTSYRFAHHDGPVRVTPPRRDENGVWLGARDEPEPTGEATQEQIDGAVRHACQQAQQKIRDLERGRSVLVRQLRDLERKHASACRRAEQAERGRRAAEGAAEQLEESRKHLSEAIGDFLGTGRS